MLFQEIRNVVQAQNVCVSFSSEQRPLRQESGGGGGDIIN